MAKAKIKAVEEKAELEDVVALFIEKADVATYVLDTLYDDLFCDSRSDTLTEKQRRCIFYNLCALVSDDLKEHAKLARQTLDSGRA
jgi:uncharacterized protein YciW